MATMKARPGNTTDMTKVRPAMPGDEHLVRDVRLQALADSPEAFWSTYEQEAARPGADWERLLLSGVTFLLEDDAGRPVGLVGAHADANDVTAGRVVSMWVHPEARGTGASDALMRTVLQWAESQGFTPLRLFVVDGNAIARRFYERHGFRPNGRHLVRPRDGRVELEMERP